MSAVDTSTVDKPLFLGVDATVPSHDSTDPESTASRTMLPGCEHLSPVSVHSG